jgi:hypothetical protein
MVRKVLYPAVFVLVVLMASSALAVGGGWKFNGIGTLDYTSAPTAPYNLVDGKIYENDGVTLVGDGSLLQIVIGLEGADIIDPLAYFDDPLCELGAGNGNGVIDGTEADLVAAWVQAGADPADLLVGGISVNVLAYGSLGFTGEFGTTAGAVNWAAPAGSEPIIANGVAQDKLAWRAWNLSKEDLLKWCNLAEHPEMFGTELWYTDGREYFTHGNTAPGPDTGWWIGMPALGSGGDVTTWVGFNSKIGAEIYAYYVDGETTARSENKLDHYLGICVPEPGTMLLIGGAIVLLLARRKK